MFCKYCGNELDEFTGKYCTNCGAEIIKHEQSDILIDSGKDKNVINIIAFIAFLLASIFMFTWLFNTNNVTDFFQGSKTKSLDSAFLSSKYKVLGEKCSEFVSLYEAKGGSILNGYDADRVCIGGTDADRRVEWEAFLRGFEYDLADDCEIYFLQNKDDDYISLLIFAEDDIITSYHVMWTNLDVNISQYLKNTEFAEIKSLNKNINVIMDDMVGTDKDGKNWDKNAVCRPIFEGDGYSVQFKAERLNLETGGTLNDWNDMWFLGFYVDGNTNSISHNAITTKSEKEVDVDDQEIEKYAKEDNKLPFLERNVTAVGPDCNISQKPTVMGPEEAWGNNLSEICYVNGKNLLYYYDYENNQYFGTNESGEIVIFGAPLNMTDTYVGDIVGYDAVEPLKYYTYKVGNLTYVWKNPNGYTKITVPDAGSPDFHRKPVMSVAFVTDYEYLGLSDAYLVED